MKYIVERMSNKDFAEYMMGGYNYNVEQVTVEAENAAEAAKKAEVNGYVVNKGFIKTSEEIAAMKAEREAMMKEMEDREAAAKAKRAEREAAKAAEAGMTVAEYRAEKARRANIKRVENEIARLEKELAAKRAKLEKLMK